MDELDDLFDQIHDELEEHLDIPVPVDPPPGLRERIDELRLNGCSDKISWSKIGSIAYITSDHRNVRICNLRFHNSDGSWVQNDTADAGLTEWITRIYKGRELVHVAWNPNSSIELLVADAYGRIGLFMVSLAINRLTGAGVLNIDPEDSLNALVGLSWLNMQRTVPFSRPAQMTDGQWKYSLMSLETKGPYAPAPKTAFVAVTRGGHVRLGITGQNQFHQEARQDLDGFSTSGDVLTHAAICSEKDDTVLTAVHTFSKQIRLYSIKIDWHPPKPNDPSQLTPSIDCQHLTVIESFSPSLDAVMLSQQLLGEPELSHLDIIPRAPDRPGEPSQPRILATFTNLANNGNNGGLSYSIFSTWDLSEEVPVLDPTFSELEAARKERKAAPSDLKPEKVLKRQEDVRIDRVVLSIQVLHHSTTLAVLSSDGGVDFRNRDLAVLPMDTSASRVSSLAQLGLCFNNREPCLHITLSPNSTIKAFFGKDNELKISNLQLNAELIDLGGIATVPKIAGAFVMANFVSEVNNFGSNTNDDLLMAMQSLMQHMTEIQKKNLQDMFLMDVYRVFGFHDKLLDATQLDKTIRSPTSVRCLSLQAAIGNSGERLNRSLTSKIAYTTLSMRNFALSFTMAFARNATSSEQDINKPDVLQYSIDLIAWFCTLADYICDQLLELNRTLDVKAKFDAEALKARIAHLNTPILHLVLSSFARTLLRHDCRGLRSIAPYAQSQYAQPGSPLSPLYASLISVFRNSVVTPPVFEALLGECDALVKRAYDPLTASQRQEAEISVLVMGEIPDVLLPAVHSILTDAVDKLRKGCGGNSEADLAFKDWSVLGLLDDARSKRWRRDTLFDGLRKIELKKGTRTRICTRCGAMMEDLFGPRLKRGGSVFAQLFRTCFCGGHFLMDALPKGEI